MAASINYFLSFLLFFLSLFLFSFVSLSSLGQTYTHTIKVLAGINTLDVELTVGQMQGKFQLAVVENVGHAVHEDAPGKVADIVVTFLSRFKHLKKNAQCAFYPPAC